MNIPSPGMMEILAPPSIHCLISQSIMRRWFIDGDRSAQVLGKVDFSENLSYHIAYGKVAIEHEYVSGSIIVNKDHNYRLWINKAEDVA